MACCRKNKKPTNDINTEAQIHQPVGHQQVEGASPSVAIHPNANSSPQTSTQIQRTKANKVTHERKQRLNKLEQQEIQSVQRETTSANKRAHPSQAPAVTPLDASAQPSAPPATTLANLTHALEDVTIVPFRDYSRDAAVPSQSSSICKTDMQEVDVAKIQSSANKQELSSLSVEKLRSLAIVAGVSADKIEDARDGHDPQSELADLIIMAKQQAKQDALPTTARP
jgi:hypothetical protein